MKPSSRLVRTPCQFPAALFENLNNYALSAAAAGVAVLALHPPSSAEIVYTPADEPITNGERLGLDLNHDGVIDFELLNYIHFSTTPFGDDLLISPAVAGNGIVGGRPKSYYAAADLPAGIKIGPELPFVRQRAVMAFASLTAETYVSGGPWKNATDRFLGLKFLINGEVHFGWARLTVLANKKHEEVTATLTGYAYETIAGRPIRAGQTHGTAGGVSTESRADSPTEPALGLLALGSRGLEAWRRKETE